MHITGLFFMEDMYARPGNPNALNADYQNFANTI
jgi:hypothetical protein